MEDRLGSSPGESMDERERRERDARGRERPSRRGVWNREGCEAFRGKLRSVRIGGEGIEEEWEKMERVIKNAIRKVGREERKKGNRNRG